MKRSVDRIAPFIPYIAVAFGMYGMRSAWAALGLYHAGMLIALMGQRQGRVAQGNSQYRSRWLPIVTIVFAMGGVLFYVLWPLLGSEVSMLADRLALFGVNGNTWPYLAVYFCLVNSTLEELFWRGRFGSDTRQITSNDLLFAGYHSFVMIAFANLVWAVPVFIVCAFGGWLWRWLRSLSGGLVLPILTHIVADTSIVIAVHLRAFR